MKNKNMTYAQVADKLTKKIGELEEKAKSSDRFARETAAQMLPRYKQKLDALFAEQERVKQKEFSQDLQNFQMKWGGKIPQYGVGGDIAAGAVGLIGGALGTVPLVGDIAQNALYGLHGKLDKDLTDQEKSIRGYGQAAGALGAGAITGNFMGAIPDAMQGIQSGYQYGMAYGGMLPKMFNGGEPGEPVVPQSGESWGDFLARASAAGMPEQDTWDPETQTMIPGALNMYNDPNTRMAQQTKYTAPGFRPQVVDSGMKDANGNPIMTHTAVAPIKPNQAMLDRAANGDKEAQRYIDNYNQNTSPEAIKNEDGTYTIPGVDYPEQSPYEQPGMPKSSPGEPDPTGGTKPWQELLYRGAAYAPTIYNTIQGLRKPQVLNHEDFQNRYEQKAMDLMAGRRYNIDPQLQSNRSTLNNMKENLAKAIGGHAGAYLSNLGNLQMNTDKMNEAAYAMKQNMDNQYMAEEAGMLGDLGAMRAKTKLGIQDINDKNRAVKAAHMAKATEGLSNIAQNERYMQGLSKADQARIMALQNMPWDYIPQFGGDKQFTGFEYYANPANQTGITG